MAFEDFWSKANPKVAKGAARRAWSAAVKKVSPDTILERYDAYHASLRAQKAQTGWAPNPKYPATWLNGECWGDVLYCASADVANYSVNGLAKSRADAIKRCIRTASMSDAYVRDLVRQGLVTADEARRAGYLV